MKQRGFVSLLTTIFISLLLLIISTSIISIEALQLRKADDSEQALRAYYAAEAGVEDAVGKVLSGTAVAPGCNVSPASFDANGESWTCQQVALTGSPAGKLSQPDVATTVDPGATTPPFGSVVLEWNTSSNAGGYNVNLAGGFPACGAGPNCASYTYSAPPIEVAVVAYPPGNFVAGDPGLSLENALIVPSGGAAGVVDYTTLPGHGPYQANCAALTGRTLPLPYSSGMASANLGYNCYAVITNLNPSSNYLFRIRTRYQPSSYQMVFKANLDGSGSVVNVPNGMALIDVTARAGTEYRRVISQLTLSPTASGDLNYVIYSDTNICKDFDVISGNPPISGCPYP